MTDNEAGAVERLLAENRRQLAAMDARMAQHKLAVDALREKVNALDEINDELVRKRRERAEVVRGRWAFRRAYRELRETVSAARPVCIAGKARNPWQMNQKWRMDPAEIARDLVDRLSRNALKVTPGLGGPGVYVLFDGDTVTYVGQAVRVAERVGRHMGDKRFQKAAFVPCHTSQLNRLERLMIDVLLPRDNCDSRTQLLRRAARDAAAGEAMGESISEGVLAGLRRGEKDIFLRELTAQLEPSRPSPPAPNP